MMSRLIRILSVFTLLLFYTHGLLYNKKGSCALRPRFHMSASKDDFSLKMENGFKSFCSKFIPILATTMVSMTNIAHADFQTAPWSDRVQYEIIQSNENGAKPKVGDLVAIRFRATYKGVAIDDTFKTDQPYYYRCGVGSVVKGLDDAVVNMHEGDKYILKFGGDLAFGAKGRPSAPGVPRIPPNAELQYEVLLEQVPGTGDEFIADE